MVGGWNDARPGSLVPALRARLGESLPAHVRDVDAGVLSRVNLIDATPIGVNVRSTVATYSGVLDELRRALLTHGASAGGGPKRLPSHNTGSLRCPTCDRTGQITLDVQFCPTLTSSAPKCRGAVTARRRHRSP